jgi:hypothetical protein
MKPWERYAQQAPQGQPTQPAPAGGPWERYAAPAPAAESVPLVEEPPVLAEQPGAVEALGAGAVRGARDPVDSGAYLVPKALAFATSAYGLVPDNPIAKFFGSEASRVSDLNKQAEQQYQDAYGGSGWATGGRVAGNVATAFLPGTGQTQAANAAQQAWRAGGALNKLRSMAMAGGLGAGQGTILGTKTDDDSAIVNALLGFMGGAGGQAIVGGGTDAVNAVRRMRAGAPYRAGERLTRAAVGPDRAIQNLTNAPELVPGAMPMAHQAADDAGIARLGKVVRNYSATIPAREIEQDAARRAVLEGISPITSAPIESATNAGNIIARNATENRNVLREAINAAYNVPELQGAYLTPPSGDLQAVLRRYYPGAPLHGVPNATEFRGMIDDLSGGIPMRFPDVNLARSTAQGKSVALANTDPRASAAFGNVQRILDDTFDNAVQAGNLAPESAKAFDAARALRRTMGERYDTGPAKAIFQWGADDLPKAQGAEVARGFFNSGATQGIDIDRLQQLVPGDAEALQALRNYAITDLDAFASKAGGELSSSRFNSWIRGRAEALPGLFEPDQVQALHNVGTDLARAERATAMAAARGGSDTEMNRILSSTAIDSPILTGVIDQVVRRVPLVGPTTANLLRGAQTGLSESARRRAAEELAQIILDPQRTVAAMNAFRGAQATMVAPPALPAQVLTPALAGMLAQ